MTYTQVKAAFNTDSFELVFATQAQITKLEAEFQRTGNEHGAEWIQMRYNDFRAELKEL